MYVGSLSRTISVFFSISGGNGMVSSAPIHLTYIKTCMAGTTIKLTVLKTGEEK